MDLTKCEAFLRAVDSGSITAVAESMEYTQSGISRMMNALEDEVGFPLLIRNKKGVAPTADGKRMIPIIRELVRLNEQASQMCAEIRGIVYGNLTIGTYYSVAAYWLPTIIKNFQKNYPEIHINIREGSNSDLIPLLDDHRLDCCFFAEFPDMACDWIPLKKDELVVWLPKDHPKAKLKAYPLAELDGEPFIITMPGRDTDIDRLLKQDGLTPDIRFSTADAYSTYAMVAAGLGVSLNNELITRNWTGEVVTLPFDPPRRITLGIAVPSLNNASPAAKKFIECARKTIRQIK